MKTKNLILFLLVDSISALSFSQVTENSLTTTVRKDSVVHFINIGKGYRSVKPLTFGSEISGFFFYREYSWIESYGVSLALYPGHSFSFNKMIHCYTEHSPTDYTYNERSMDYKYSDTFILFAPGISIFSLNRKYSLDVYKKLETPIYDNGKQSIAPLKVNVHF